MFDPFIAQEFQDGLRKWDRLRSIHPAAESDETPGEQERDPDELC